MQLPARFPWWTPRSVVDVSGKCTDGPRACRRRLAYELARAAARYWLYWSQPTALPQSFGQLTALQTMRLYDNQLTALLESFGQLTALRTLRLHTNQLTALPGSSASSRLYRSCCSNGIR